MKINIMNHGWKIKIKEQEEMNQFENGTLGVTLFPNRIINLSQDLKEEKLEQVSTHEVVHALLDEFGCSNLGNYNDEFICDFIANNIKLIDDLKNVVVIIAKKKIEEQSVRKVK